MGERSAISSNSEGKVHYIAIYGAEVHYTIIQQMRDTLYRHLLGERCTVSLHSGEMHYTALCSHIGKRGTICHHTGEKRHAISSYRGDICTISSYSRGEVL